MCRLVACRLTRSVRTASPVEHGDEIRVHEDGERLVVTTGPLRFAVNRRRFSLVETAALGRTEPDGTFVPEVEVAGPGGDAWVRIRGVVSGR